MKLLTLLALSAAVAAWQAGGVYAADAIAVPTTTPVEIPIHDDSRFDWNGFYAGIYGNLQRSDAAGAQFGLGVDAGVTAQFNFYLLGAEVAVHGVAGGDVGSSAYGQILGRAGLIVGDDVAIYAAGGYGMDLGAPDERDFLLGGGVEVPVTDTVSVRVQYLHGFPLEGENPKDQFSIGASYHF